VELVPPLEFHVLSAGHRELLLQLANAMLQCIHGVLHVSCHAQRPPAFGVDGGRGQEQRKHKLPLVVLQNARVVSDRVLKQHETLLVEQVDVRAKLHLEHI
jgi:hypothetical protein